MRTLTKRETNLRDDTTAHGKPMQTGIPNSSLLDMLEHDTPSDPGLDDKMQQRMLELQRPDAEREATSLSRGIDMRADERQVKEAMGERMGADFSAVRFHTDAASAHRAQAMGARAFTTGRDVYFGPQGFAPDVAAHELAHTVQQGFVAGEAPTVSAPAGTVQMLRVEKANPLPDRRFRQPDKTRYQETDFTKATRVETGEEGTLKFSVREISGLGTVTGQPGFANLKKMPGLTAALTNLEELAASGKDYSTDKMGRQYLLGIFSTAESAISRYINDQMQDSNRNRDKDFRLTALPEYETVMALLDSIRLAHQQVVSKVAMIHKENPKSTELPVYDGVFDQGNIVDTLRVQSNALKSWRNIVSGTGTIQFANKENVDAAMMRKFLEQHGPEYEQLKQSIADKEKTHQNAEDDKQALAKLNEEKEKMTQKEMTSLTSIQDDDPFKAEALSYCAKMLEIPTGRSVLDVARKSSNKILMTHFQTRQAANGLQDDQQRGYTPVPENTEGNFFEADPDMTNIHDVIEAVSMSRKTEKNPNGYTGILLGGKKYKFGEGVDILLSMERGSNPRKSSGDIGENGVFAQTSPWVVFGHEMAHAIKGQHGITTQAGADGGHFNNKKAFSSSKLRDYNNQEEELANWYLEDAMRSESLTGKKVAYNPYSYYSSIYSHEDTNVPVSSYITGVHSLHRQLENSGLLDDPRFAPFKQEFDQKSQEMPDLYDPSLMTPTTKATVGYQNLKLSDSGKNVYKLATEGKYFLSSVNNYTSNSTPDKTENPRTGFEKFRDDVGIATKQARIDKHQKIKTNFAPMIDFLSQRSKKYNADAGYMNVRRQVEKYNAAGETGDYSVSSMMQMIDDIDDYLAKDPGRHKGRKAKLEKTKREIQNALAKLKSGGNKGPKG